MVDKIKVLIIATTKFELNGITNVILNYYRAMDKTDMEIDFVVPNNINYDLKTEIESEGSHIFQLSERNNKPLNYLKRLTKIIYANKYDIVHAHGNSCTLAIEMLAAKKGGSRVRIAHSHSTSNKYKLAHKVLRVLFNATYTHAFACGKEAGEWLFEGKPYTIINNGINVNKYIFNEAVRKEYRNRYGINNKKLIGHVGNFTYPKNHEYLIDVFEELYKLDDNYRLILIGDGELKTCIENKVNQLGLSNVVVFVGRTPEVPQLMQAIDMIVMPSFFEGLPLTLVEAQTACLPCFVSDAISKEAAITNLTEFISLEKSIKEWADQINNSKTLVREEMKNDIYTKVINAGYSITDNARRMKELYRTYIEQMGN